MQIIEDDANHPVSQTLRSVRLSIDDAPEQLRLMKSCMTVLGEKGNRVVRATHGINQGYMYFEIRFNRYDALPLDTRSKVQEQQQQALLQLQLQSHRNHAHHNLYYYNLRHADYDESARIRLIQKAIANMSQEARKQFRKAVYAEHPPETVDIEYMGPAELLEVQYLYYSPEFEPPFFIGQVRVGFSRATSDLNIPLGGEDSSFAYCSSNGCKAHRALSMPYGERFHPGDVIGCLLYLPSNNDREDGENGEKRGQSCRTDGKSTCTTSPSASKLGAELNQFHYITGSSITFYKNGMSLGVAFEDLAGGTYFPSVSLYQFSSVTFNFGPDFAYPPPEICVPTLVKTSSLFRATPFLAKTLRTALTSNPALKLKQETPQLAQQAQQQEDSQSSKSGEPATGASTEDISQTADDAKMRPGEHSSNDASSLETAASSETATDSKENEAENQLGDSGATNWPSLLPGETKDTYFDVYFLDDAEFHSRKRTRPATSSAAASRNRKIKAALAATVLAGPPPEEETTSYEEDFADAPEYLLRYRLREAPRLVPNPNHTDFINARVDSSNIKRI